MNGSYLARVATWIVAAVVGALFGAAGTVSHSYALGPIPVGLIVAVLACAAVLVAVRLVTADRWATLATGIGMMAAILLLSGEGPGGSVLVPQAPDGAVNPGILWIVVIPLVVAVAVAWPSLRPAATGGRPESAD